MIVPCNTGDFTTIYDIINDGASAYKGIIPADRWHEPYMSITELQTQIEEGVQFWCYKPGQIIEGVMGIQFKEDVTLIRHAYVRTAKRNSGICGGNTVSNKTGDVGTNHGNTDAWVLKIKE